MSARSRTSNANFYRVSTASALSLLTAILLAGCNVELDGSSTANSDNADDSPANGDGSVTLTWVQPTERVNGQTLTDDDISGYAIRYRASSDVPFESLFVENCHSTSCSHKLEDLDDPSRYVIQVAAVDSVGLHSAYVSAEH